MSSLTLAWRSLRRSPAFAIAAALTLAIGIGATTAVFTVLNAVLLQPLPYRDPSRLAGLWHALPGMGFNFAPQSSSTFFTYRRLARSIEGIAVFDRAAVNLADGSGGRPERVRASLVTASFFPLLGTPLARGRAFTEAEDVPNGNHVVIISDGLWRRRFGADPGVIGKRIEIDGRQHDVVGVAPQSFAYPDAATQLWLPIALDSLTPFGGAFAHQGFVRLKPGVTLEAAQREFTALVPRVGELFPNIAPGMPTSAFLASARASAKVLPMRDDVVGNFGRVVWIAGAAGLLLLLIAVANVASLLLARADGRQRELAVRVALGAGPLRVLGQFFADALVLAALGGAAGLALATIGVRSFVHLGPAAVPRLQEVGVDGTVVAFTILVTLFMALLCSIVPALRYDAKRLSLRLRDGARGGTTGRDRQRSRRVLVVTQVALATVLVGGAGLLLRSLERLRNERPGFDADHALTLWLSLPGVKYSGDSAVVRFSSQLLARASGVPGARAVGISSKVPLLQLGIGYTPVWTDADREVRKSLPPAQQVVSATEGYFAAMGIPLVAGRSFYSLDRQQPYEAIVDQSLARQYWGDSTGARALGHRLRVTEGVWFTVVGVVGAVHDTSLAAPPNGIIYVPNVTAPDSNNSNVARTFALTVRTTGDPRALVGSVQRAVADIDPSLPAFNVRPMSDTVEQSMTTLSFVMLILAVTAGAALILAAVGLYGVLAYVVSLRRKEIGVRLALGAGPRGVARLVTGQGATLAAVGVVAGTLLFVLGSRFLGALIFGVGGPDALTILTVSAFLMLVAFGASWIPARRAARIDPATALVED